MKIHPRNEYVNVSLQEARKHRSGILLPGEVERNLMVVEMVGPGGLTVEGKRMPIEIAAGVPLKKGDIVFVKGGEYEQYENNGVRHMLIPQSAIIGIEMQDNND